MPSSTIAYATRSARKPHGGFVLLTVEILCLLWWVYRQRYIQLRDLRVWLACQEMVARRCQLPPDQGPALYAHGAPHTRRGRRGTAPPDLPASPGSPGLARLVQCSHHVCHRHRRVAGHPRPHELHRHVCAASPTSTAACPSPAPRFASSPWAAGPPSSPPSSGTSSGVCMPTPARCAVSAGGGAKPRGSRRSFRSIAAVSKPRAVIWRPWGGSRSLPSPNTP